MSKNFHKNDKNFYTAPDGKKAMPTPFYPEVKFSFNEVADHEREPHNRLFVYEIHSVLRVKHEDVWYGQKFLDTGVVPVQVSKEVANQLISHALTRFHTNIYLAQLFGRVDPSLRDRFGGLIFIPLSDQRNERERLKEVFRLSL